MPVECKVSHTSLSPDGSLAIATGASFGGQSLLLSTRAVHVAITAGRAAGPPPGGVIVDAASCPISPTYRHPHNVLRASQEEGQEVEAWDWASGSRRAGAGRLPSTPPSLAYRPDGHRIAVLCSGGELLILDDEGREAARWQAHEEEPAHHWIN